MAIRSGTGGLKYPLPSMYQLGVQQSAAAASSGGSASSSAYGANRSFAANKMRVQADLANSAAERDFRARSQLEGQSFRAQQEFYDREHQKGAQLEGQRFRANESQLDRDFTTQRDQVLFEQDQVAFERKRDAEIEMNIQSGNLQLPPDAQAEMDKLEAGRRDAPKIVDSPEQQAEFDRQYEARKRQILRTARPPQGPSPTERANQGRTFYNPATGGFSETMQPGSIPGRLNESGEFQPTIDTTESDKRQAEENRRQQEAEQKRREDQQKLNNEIYEEAQKRVDDGVSADFESARDEVLKNRRAAGASAPEPAPAAPPSPKGPVSDSSSAKTGTGNAPEAPMQPPVGMGESVEARSSVPGQSPVPGSGSAEVVPLQQAQTMAVEIRAEMKDAPLSAGETPQMRDYFDQNMESILQYQDTPLEQIPEEARGPVDFYGRVLRSATQGQPIVLKTPEEAAMLPPDTPFIDDQGQPRRTPKAKGSAK